MTQQSKSTLFLIRLWSDKDDGSQAEWQGRIQPIGEGRAATFSDWPTLQHLLQEMLLDPQENSNRPDQKIQDEQPPLYFHPNPFQ